MTADICSKSDTTILNELAKESNDRLSVKARIILLAAEGRSSKEIAELLSERPNTVSISATYFHAYIVIQMSMKVRGTFKTPF